MSESELTNLYLSEVRTAIDSFAANNIPFAGMLVCPILANEGLPDIPNGFMPQAGRNGSRCGRSVHRGRSTGGASAEPVGGGVTR